MSDRGKTLTKGEVLIEEVPLLPPHLQKDKQLTLAKWICLFSYTLYIFIRKKENLVVVGEGWVGRFNRAAQ